MIVEEVFFFHGLVRWNLGWPTPNYAGAFIATLIVWCWAIPYPKIDRNKGHAAWMNLLTWLGIILWYVAGLVLEAVGYFLLAKTYSRGALVAVAVAAAFFVGSHGRKPFLLTWRLWAIRICVLVVCVWATGFGERIRPDAAWDDGAVVNRVALWKGGLEMIASAPLRGWGAGESGRAYMNWFQDVDRTEGYTTTVNSYLHVAVERGLPSLACGLFLLIWLLIRGCQSARQAFTKKTNYLLSHRVKAAAGASLLAWAVANVFTTLWIEPKLWLIPTIAIGVLVWPSRHRGRRHFLSTVLLAGSVSITACGLLSLAGWWNARNARVRVQPSRGVVVVERNDSEHPVSGEYHVWPDAAVLGTMPGKELRQWEERSTKPMRLWVHRIETASGTASITPMNRTVLFGRQCARVVYEDAITSGHRQWLLIHPSVPPPLQVRTASSMVIILPEIDELGLNAAWRKWAGDMKARVLISPGVGLDIRAVWPEMIQKIEQG